MNRMFMIVLENYFISIIPFRMISQQDFIRRIIVGEDIPFENIRDDCAFIANNKRRKPICGMYNL